jgi:competence protein ComEC
MANRNNKILWKKAPFLRLLLPLLIGILVETYFHPGIFILTAFFLFSMLMLIFYSTFSIASKAGFEMISGLVVQMVFFYLGRIIVAEHRDVRIKDFRGNNNLKSDFLIVQLISDPVQKNKTRKSTAQILWYYENQIYYTANERILVYWRNDMDGAALKSGDRIVIRNDLLPIENIKGLPDFDYKKYCQLRHIYSQVFLKKTNFLAIDSENKHAFSRSLDLIRKKFLSIIKYRIPDKSAYGFMEALMVGFTDDLNPDLLKTYADSGVIHIIAISGLHLALIFHLLSQIFSPLPKNKSLQWIKLFLILTILWGYSLLSGASPSVIRSAMMFSFVLFSRNILREVSVFNTLSGSAFLLLCFDPSWIWDTGFQLSYAAVLSLCLFSSTINKLFLFKNKALIHAWDACSVSLAAQILTTPISIFYFHQFPCYFLLANLLAVPLSSLILIGGIVLCLFSFAAPIARLLGIILGMIIQFLNAIVSYISGLPGAVWKDLSITLYEMVILYIIIFSIYRIISSRKKSWVFICLGLITLLQCFRLLL